jgi:hypothetical protein
VPVGDEDHRVIARTVARAFLGGAEERGDFVAGEVVAEARFAGHAYNLPRLPSPASPRAEPACERPARVKAPALRSRCASSCRPVFSAGTRNITPKALPVVLRRSVPFVSAFGLIAAVRHDGFHSA